MKEGMKESERDRGGGEIRGSSFFLPLSNLSPFSRGEIEDRN